MKKILSDLEIDLAPSEGDHTKDTKQKIGRSRFAVNLEMRREEIRIRHFPRKFRSKSVAHGSAQFEHDGLQPEGSLRRSADVASRVPG